MGVHLKYGTAGATGGGWSGRPGALQPSYGEDHAEPRYSWQARSPKTVKDPIRWYSLWSFGCRVSGASLDGEYTQRGVASIDLFEPYSCDGPGSQNVNFLRGLCVDATETPVANAIVQAFVTATDVYLGEMQGHTDGTYAVGVQASKATPCYLVAYKPGSPDIAGTTVNTLLPTNVDGTT